MVVLTADVFQLFIKNQFYFSIKDAAITYQTGLFVYVTVSFALNILVLVYIRVSQEI